MSKRELFIKIHVTNDKLMDDQYVVPLCRPEDPCVKLLPEAAHLPAVHHPSDD